MATVTESTAPSLDPASLKARFKGLCIQSNNVHQNWQIRVHRSLSWYRRALELPEDQPEVRFLLLWIAFNSLYSRWNTERNAPDADAHSRQDFLRRLCAMDRPAIGDALKQHRGLVNKLLSNPYLAGSFWREPENPKAKGWATEDANYLQRNLRQDEYCKVLGQALDRLYVLRGQIVHGASTGGSRLNRSSLKYSMGLLRLLVPLIQHIVIEHGCGDDWPELCYPPVS